MSAFVIALQFLTRIPLRSTTEWQGPAVGRSVLYYPLVGLIIGGGLILLLSLLMQSPVLLSAAILLLVWVLITGGLHLDGLADSADAWAGGLGDTERSLEIMKDPRSGALAIVALVLLLLLKFSAIVAIVEANRWQALLFAPLLGRTAIVLLLLTTPYVRLQGLGSEMANYLPRKSAIIILLLVMACVVYVLGIRPSLILIVSVLIVFWILRRLMLARIGGMTGDTAGAVIELVEAWVLVVLVFVRV